MTRHVITGGLGTGKTSVLARLGKQFETVPEPARELIAEHRAATGESSLDHHPNLFVWRLIERSLRDFRSASEGAITFFDRGLPDCIGYASVFGIDNRSAMEAARRHRYDNPVFVAPPWEEIYTSDDMRAATFAQAEMFHSEVVDAYERLGYDMVSIPRAPLEDRVSFVIANLPEVEVPDEEF